VTDLNNVFCFCSHVLTCWRLSRNWFIAPTVDSRLTVLLIRSRYGPHRKLSFCLQQLPWETCPIMKEDRFLVRVYLEHLWPKLQHYYVYRERHFPRLFRHARITGRQHQRRGTVGENQHWQKEIAVNWEGLFGKITELLQHSWQQNWISILTALFLQKLSDMYFTYPTSTVGLQLLNLWLLKVILRCVNDGVTLRP
jgi:hypothetical protein